MVMTIPEAAVLAGEIVENISITENTIGRPIGIDECNEDVVAEEQFEVNLENDVKQVDEETEIPEEKDSIEDYNLSIFSKKELED